MSFVEEHLALVQKLEAEIARLKEAINQDAQYIYDLQKSQEARNTEDLDSYPIVESLFRASIETHDRIIELASKEPQYHHSWVRAVEDAIIVGNEEKAVKIAHTIRPRFINNYVNRSNTIWYTIIDKCGIDTIKEFVNMGVDIGATGPNGWNALHYAAWNKRTDVLKYLVEECEGEELLYERIADDRSIVDLVCARPNHEETFLYLKNFFNI